MKIIRLYLIIVLCMIPVKISRAGAESYSGYRLYSDSIKVLDSSGIMNEKSITAESKAHAVLNDYIDAIGGREKLSQIEDRITYMTGTVQGFEVKMKLYQKIPSSFRQEVAASGFDQIIIYNGEEGIIITGEESMRIPAEELIRIKFESSLHFLLDPESSGVKMMLTDTLTINNTPVYKIQSSADSVEWFTYYDIKDKYRILEERQVKTPAGLIKQELWFSNYKEVDGLKYPFEIMQKLGAQEINFSVTSIKTNQLLDDELFKID